MATITKIKGKTGNRFRERVRCDDISASGTFFTRDEAKRWGARMETGIDVGDYVGRDDGHRTTFIVAIDRYLAEVTIKNRGRKQEQRRARFFRRNNSLLSARELASLRGQDFAEYKRARLNEGLASNTVRIELCLFNRVFKQAKCEWGMESLRNP